jgi:CRP-like cAMP-binding protein
MSQPVRPALAALEKTELFLGLTPDALEAVADLARVRRLAADTRIFGQGDGDVHAHVVLEGGVRILQTGSDGAQAVMRFVGPGATFGTVALFTGGRYPADAVTLEDTVEASWSGAELRALIIGYPQIAMNIIRIIGGRLQEAQDRMRELATQRVEQRVAHAVLRLVHQAGHGTIDGTAIAFPLRRKDVADISGTTLYTVSRILAAWEKAGLLTSDNQQLTIHRPLAILKITESSMD